MSSNFSNNNVTGNQLNPSEDLALDRGRETTGMGVTANHPSSGEPARGPGFEEHGVVKDSNNQEQGPGAEAREGEEGLPPQLHAGNVGYGPNYHSGPGVGEKMTGMKEEIMGKMKKDQNLAQHGRDLRTGELARQERDEDMNSSAFHSSDTTTQNTSSPSTTTTTQTAQPQSQSQSQPAQRQGGPMKSESVYDHTADSKRDDGLMGTQKRVGEDRMEMGTGVGDASRSGQA